MSGRSWKFESSHGHEKQKSANSRFFLLYHYPFRVLFSTYYTKLSLVVVKKNHLFMKIFIFVSENIKMFCLGNISLSLKSTIRFFLIRISPIQCVRERDGGLRGGSINDGLFHLLMLGNVWVKSLTNLVQCVTEQKMY